MNYLLNFGEFITEGKRHRRKQKSRSRKLLRRSLSSNIPSRKNDAAKIQINRKTAIEKLENLEKSYTNIEQLYGLLRNIKLALGLQPAKGASEYGIVEIPQESGKVLIASISMSNHYSNAQTYIDKNSNCEYNLRIIIRKSKMKGEFKPHDLVVLDEFAYTGAKIKDNDNALALIIKGIVEFLKTGVYTDLTGVAVVHHSPKSREDALKAQQKIHKIKRDNSVLN